MVEVFQPAQPGAIHADQRGNEKIAQKKGVLGPEAIPLILQNADVLPVVQRAHNGGQHGQQDKSQPDGAVPKLHLFGSQGS